MAAVTSWDLPKLANADSATDVLTDADVIVVTTTWLEFASTLTPVLARVLRASPIVQRWRISTTMALRLASCSTNWSLQALEVLS
jgi:hypothetical protein